MWRFRAALILLIVAIHSSPLAFAQESTSKTLAGSLQPYVDRHELAGAVAMVATKDRVVSQDAIGFADIAANKPMTVDAVFWIASQSKPITASAFMMLVDEGKVSLDDPVEKYLPEFKGQWVVDEKTDKRLTLTKPAHPITVRNILSHTSGLPFKSAIEDPTLDRFPLEARVRSYAMSPLDFQPDTKYQYSNAGINTAARIIEVVSKVPFETFLDQRLFQPLGMRDTSFWPSPEQFARLAKSYKAGPMNKGLEETIVTQVHYPLGDRGERFPMPAGGLFSTAKDLSRFYQMLLNNGELDGKRYLSESAVKQLTMRQTPADLKNSYGLGFAVTDKTFGHGGAYATDTTAHRDRGLITIWLVQHASFPGSGKEAQQDFKKWALERP